MAADLDFFFDPVCPWAWITSRWVSNVGEQRSYEVDWRFISLWIVNEENTAGVVHAASTGPATIAASRACASPTRSASVTATRRGRTLVHRRRHGTPRREPTRGGRRATRWRSSRGLLEPADFDAQYCRRRRRRVAR